MDYSSLDLGTAKFSVAPYDIIHSVIDPTTMVDGYAKAILDEAERMNPLTFDRVGLTEDELRRYLRFLLEQRVKSVEGTCHLWSKLKALWIPSFIQYVLTMIGVVDIKTSGLRIIPTIEEQGVTFEEALAVSDKLQYFEGELAMVKDAMPRGPEGDKDTMSTALIAGYMKSIAPVEHPIATYAAAFLGLKLAEEQTFQVLYRVQYDDINYLREVLLRSSEVRGRND